MLAYQVRIGLWHRTALATTWIPWDAFVNLWVSLDHKSEYTALAPSVSDSKFSNLSEHQNQMSKLLKHRLLGPRKSELSDSVNLGAPNNLHLSQVLRWCPCCQFQKHCSIIRGYLCSPFAFPAPRLAISLPECLLLLLSLPTLSSELYLMTPHLFKAKFTAAPSSQLSVLPRVPQVPLCATAGRMLAQHAHIEDKLWVRLHRKCPEHKRCVNCRYFLWGDPIYGSHSHWLSWKTPGLWKLCLINLYTP